MAKGRKTGGRRPGSANKATASAREAISRFVDGNAHKLQEWLDKVARVDGPKAAAALYIDLVEFSVPKLARTEITGKDGQQLIVRISGIPTDESL